MEFFKRYGFYIAIIVLVFAVGGFLVNSIFSNTKQTSSLDLLTPKPSQPDQAEQLSNLKTMTKPEMQLTLTKTYSAVLHTTEGDVTIEFDTKNTPITSNNFIYLAKNKFYDNTIFHRVIPGFMVQGGDPTGTGMGDPGYKFDDEYLKGIYARGTVAMANSGPNTNGSQFFIMHQNYNLPNLYVIFGHVTAGEETVDKIATAPTKSEGEGSSPVNPVKITSIDIVEK